MSIEAMAAVLHHSRAKGTDKLVLLGIANHAGDGGAWPTVATLARYANVSERAVQNALGKLVQLGELAVHKQAGGTADLHAWERPNRYDVLVSCPVTCDGTSAHRQRRLPTAPADLWIEGVKQASPGEADFTRGVKPTTPEGVKQASPKPSTEPTSSTHCDLDSDGSARASVTPCDVCSLPRWDCERRAHVSGHTYRPVKRDPQQVVERVREHYADAIGGEL